MNTQTAKELYKKAQVFIQEQKFNKALETLEKSLALEKTANAFHDLGIIYHLRNDNEKAISLLQEAANEDPKYHQAYDNLAKITYETDQMALALEYRILSIQADPKNLKYKDNFIQILKGIDFKAFVPELKPQILLCLNTDNIDHETLSRTWLSLLRHDPDFKKIYQLEKHYNYDDFEEAFLKLKSDAPLYDEYFLVGLKRLFVADLSFERLLTHIRRFILKNPSEKHLPVLAALAEYCFQSEFVFNFSAEEETAIESLKAEIESGAISAPHKIALLGCYLPLCTLKNAANIATTTQGIEDLIARQISEPFEESNYKKDIVSLTGIDDQTSKKVQEQYETFPYPRWKTIGLNYKPNINFEGKIENILIAGSGTGKEPLTIARSFPESRVLAVDISLTSLAYSIRKAKEHGIDNITFRHGDILGLGVLDQKFDLIASSGVLHHMKDPIAGWSVLMDLLRPRGYMHIGLYSKLARTYVNQARTIIKEQGYSNNAQDIRRFRKDSIENPDKELLPHLLIFRDFFSLSDCRDLLFHVMEHQFKLHEIKSQLNVFGLEPLLFILPTPIQNIYKNNYPDDSNMRNINNLIDFEKQHPQSFTNMYDFWCRKI